MAQLGLRVDLSVRVMMDLECLLQGRHHNSTLVRKAKIAIQRYCFDLRACRTATCSGASRGCCWPTYGVGRTKPHSSLAFMFWCGVVISADAAALHGHCCARVRNALGRTSISRLGRSRHRDASRACLADRCRRISRCCKRRLGHRRCH
jgi:hypothetical protein